MSKPYYVRVNCLDCGGVVLLDVPTYENYEGQIRCDRCRAMMRVKIEDCRLKSCELVQGPKTTSQRVV